MKIRSNFLILGIMLCLLFIILCWGLCKELLSRHQATEAPQVAATETCYLSGGNCQEDTAKIAAKPTPVSTPVSTPAPITRPAPQTTERPRFISSGSQTASADSTGYHYATGNTASRSAAAVAARNGVINTAGPAPVAPSKGNTYANNSNAFPYKNNVRTENRAPAAVTADKVASPTYNRVEKHAERLTFAPSEPKEPVVEMPKTAAAANACTKKGLHASKAKCLAAGNSQCVNTSDGCWQSFTCSSQGAFNSQSQCTNGLTAGTCVQVSTGCWQRKFNGFIIKYAATNQSRHKYAVACGFGGLFNAFWKAWLSKSENMAPAADISGTVRAELTDNGIQYPAGTYYLCVKATQENNNCSGGDYFWGVHHTQIIGHDLSTAGTANYAKAVEAQCFTDKPAAKNATQNCLRSDKSGEEGDAIRWSCKSYNFKAGRIYEIKLNTYGL